MLHMRLAFTRGAEATTHTAVEWAASRTVRTPKLKITVALFSTPPKRPFPVTTPTVATKFWKCLGISSAFWNFVRRFARHGKGRYEKGHFGLL